MDLPPTYYDFIRKLRPELVEMAEQDAEDLLNSPNPPPTIHSIDDYNSRFKRFIERLNAKLLGYGEDHPGVSVDEMSPRSLKCPAANEGILCRSLRHGEQRVSQRRQFRFGRQEDLPLQRQSR